MLATSVSFHTSNLDTNVSLHKFVMLFYTRFTSWVGFFLFLNELGSHEDLVQARAALCLFLFFVFY